MKLTVKNIGAQQLEPGKREQIIFDEEIPGFGLRLREGGFRGLIFQYKSGSTHRRIAMGSVGAIDLAKAREDAKDYYARVRLGQDPAAEMRDAKAKREHTFGAAAKLFLARQRSRLRPSSYVDVERHIDVFAKPLHDLELAKIERRHIAARLVDTEQNRGAVTANRLRASLSKFFAWGIGEGLLDSNPVSGTNRNEEVTRDRVLSPAELRAIWLALPDNDYGSVVKLLMLTGQRASEIADLRWPEIVDFRPSQAGIVGDEIRLPGERTKNHRAHTVPLTKAALKILEAVPPRTKPNGTPRELVFGSGEGGFSGWSKAKDQLDERIAEMTGEPVVPFRIHDLRRSFATHAAEIGIQPHIIEAILNHVSGSKAGVAGIYNRALYEADKRIAMDRWADQLLAWVEERESNVTPLLRA
jgi:integrase